MLKKQDKNSMQTEELIGPGGCMGHPQSYGVIHCLDESSIDEYSVLVKKLHHKTISHLFSRVADIRGHKDNISAAKKTLDKIWCKVSIECIKFPTFTKYQKTKKNHLETQTNAQINKRQNLAIKNSSKLANFSTPLK
jgi:hypothetical protein